MVDAIEGDEGRGELIDAARSWASGSGGGFTGGVDGGRVKAGDARGFVDGVGCD
eukprot:GAFH01005879.1.p7 GENE.GAFH01005879.1~~GAFH01005879.1.p7  ORF type:complete len:54 (-),score=0.47 GAFH01005879.1:168-329(-)